MLGGDPDGTYAIETSSDLSKWQADTGFLTANANGSISVEKPTTETSRFFRMRQVPTGRFSIRSSATTGTLLMGNDITIGSFTIVADSSHDVGWKGISFSVFKTKELTLGSFALWDTTAQVQVAGSFTVSNAGNSFDNSEVGMLSFTASNEVVLPGGSSHNYELRAAINNITQPMSFLLVYVEKPSATFTIGTTAEIIASGASVVWTDRSAANHSESSTDWFTDYILAGPPLRVGELVLQF